MSFQSPNAYLPSDLLDSDDEVTNMKACIGNVLDEEEEAPTADNSSNSGNNSSSENNSGSIFSVQPTFIQNIAEDPIVGWKCSSCENFNCKGRTECYKCEKARATEDGDVTKKERKQMRTKKPSKVNKVIQQEDGKFVGITRSDRVVEFTGEYNHALDNRCKKRKTANNKKRDAGNWTCQGCFNHNFSFRQNCN
jgi:hypothetical protein